MNKKTSERKGILIDKGTHLVNAVGQPTISSKVKDNSRKTCVITIN